MKEYDVAVIGGGPAGMAAALTASENGVSVVLIERDDKLGGILNQCIHNGFGLHYFKEELTGPEYAARFSEKVLASNIDVMLNSFALNITEEKTIFVVSGDEGIVDIKAKSIVLSTGCRERSAGAIGLAGDRPAGIYTAGMAQKLCNIEGKLVGKNIVILGSGDIGLIMARRMTFEGAKVIMVCEMMPYSGGLKRNIVQCLNDFNIPLYFSTTVTRIVGEKRVEGVYIADVINGKPDLSTERFVECDTLLLSVGLIPENDIINGSHIIMNPVTNGPLTDEYRQTSISGIFACGNTLHVHDLVDNVTEEAILTGESCARYVKNNLAKNKNNKNIKCGKGIRYILPSVVNGVEGEVKLFFRTDNIYKNATIKLLSNDQVIYSGKKMILTPGEMETIRIKKEDLTEVNEIRLEM